VSVVVVARIGANLLAEGGVHEIDVPQVAVEECEGGEAVLVGEHRRVEDDARLLVGPALEVLAAEDVEDALVRVVRHHNRHSMEDTCQEQWR
jgi:hypothetical protein